MNVFDRNTGVDGVENAAVGGDFPARVWLLLMERLEGEKGTRSWKFENLECWEELKGHYLMERQLLFVRNFQVPVSSNF